MSEKAILALPALAAGMLAGFLACGFLYFYGAGNGGDG